MLVVSKGALRCVLYLGLETIKVRKELHSLLDQFSDIPRDRRGFTAIIFQVNHYLRRESQVQPAKTPRTVQRFFIVYVYNAHEGDASKSGDVILALKLESQTIQLY
jgi:hypothetical protein